MSFIKIHVYLNISSVIGMGWNKVSNLFLSFFFLAEEELTIHLSKTAKQDSYLTKAEKLVVLSLKMVADPKSKCLRLAWYICFYLEFHFIKCIS